MSGEKGKACTSTSVHSAGPGGNHGDEYAWALPSSSRWAGGEARCGNAVSRGQINSHIGGTRGSHVSTRERPASTEGLPQGKSMGAQLVVCHTDPSSSGNTFLPLFWGMSPYSPPILQFYGSCQPEPPVSHMLVQQQARDPGQAKRAVPDFL